MGKKPKIIIFEDEQYIGDIYSTKFEQVGFSVEKFQEYSSVVGIIAKEKPDIICCDIRMPGEIVDGIEAIRLLKTDEKTKDIPIIVVSNFSDDELVIIASRLGTVKYLIKSSMTPTEIAEVFIQHLIKTKKFTVKDFKNIK